MSRVWVVSITTRVAGTTFELFDGSASSIEIIRLATSQLGELEVKPSDLDVRSAGGDRIVISSGDEGPSAELELLVVQDLPK